jgi:hypothetical protein
MCVLSERSKSQGSISKLIYLEPDLSLCCVEEVVSVLCIVNILTKDTVLYL